MSAEWQECKLGDVITLQRGFDLPQRQRSGGSVPVVSSSGITGFHSVAKVKAPGVVTGRYGTLGQVHYVTKDFWPHNTTLFVKDFKGNYPHFISYFLRTLNFSAQNVAGAVPGINRNYLYLLPVRLPSLPVQRKITAVLSAYDHLIENNLRRIKILEEMAQNLYRDWFVNFRYPGWENGRKVDSPLGQIPEGWEVVPFTEIADVLSGGTPKTSVKEYWGGSIPFFAPKDCPDSFYAIDTEKTITELGLSKCSSKLYPANTVFITARGTVGKVVMAAKEMAMNQSCYALRGKPGINQLYLFLTTLEQVDYLKKNTGGATFDTIVIDTFRRMVVAKPNSEVADRFSQLVRPVMGLILNILQKNTNLRRNRDLLLPKLISGELDVSELDITVPQEDNEL
jgi:type I restriction enzyme, S subunit